VFRYVVVLLVVLVVVVVAGVLEVKGGAIIILSCGGYNAGIQVSKDGEVYEEVARMEMEDLTSLQAAAPIRVAAQGEMISYVRIQMMGYARYNDQAY